MNDKTLIAVVCGPTASGKTRLAVDLAQELGGEVINADSMQVYRGMDIAVAMPLESERAGVSHHLFGIIEPERVFSVADWLTFAREKISEVSKRGSLPIIVGGTGLYISALTDNIVFDNTGSDRAFREEMQRLASERGNAFLLDKLREVDPVAALELHENNVKRVIRALETYKLSGLSSSTRAKMSRETPSPYETCIFGIDFKDRRELYTRIDLRVDIMVQNGLVDEARSMQRRGLLGTKATSAQAIGHKELLPFLNNEAPLDECVSTLKMKTRNYAKRQLTWFRRDKRIQWAVAEEHPNFGEILTDVTKSVKSNKYFYFFENLL